MRCITILLVFLVVTLLSTFAQGADQSVVRPTDLRKACLKKSGGNNVVAAIEKFCKNTNIVRPLQYHVARKQASMLIGNRQVVPGPVAGRGGSGGPKGQSAFIKIAGKCSPPQWVPQKYCLQQFFYMCWKGNSRGSMEKVYGRKQCQSWLISN